jgi:nucleoside 2-deoxyribosyltransferase
MSVRVYLAGPDVFLRDAEARAAAKKAICARHGLTGVSPLDTPDHEPAGWDALPEWQRIARHNEAHIAAATAVVADLTPFRGASADAGTVYEVGYARGLGRPVFGYSTVAAGYTDRVLALLGATVPPDAERDGDDLLIERFGLHDNLMIDAGIATGGGVLLAEDVPRHARWTDLSLFTRCVEMVAAHLLR